MSNCTKCGIEVDHPLKSWKIKQTTVGLYECPSCKTKWRGKFVETATISPEVPSYLAGVISKPIPAEDHVIAERTMTSMPTIRQVEPVVDDEPKPERTGFLAGLRTFLSNFFADT